MLIVHPGVGAGGIGAECARTNRASLTNAVLANARLIKAWCPGRHFRLDDRCQMGTIGGPRKTRALSTLTLRNDSELAGSGLNGTWDGVALKASAKF